MLRSSIISTTRSLALGSPAAQSPASIARRLWSLADLAANLLGQSSKAEEQLKAATLSSLEKVENGTQSTTKSSSAPFHSAQFGDSDTARSFMHVHSSGSDSRTVDMAALVDEFRGDVGEEMQLKFEIVDEDVKLKTMLMVFKLEHRIYDLLYRYSVGTLPVTIPCIVSNHSAFAALAAQHNIPFHHPPIDGEHSQEWQEEQILKLVEQHQVDLVVLARYMQILSPTLCELMSSRIFSIHYSLPSFKGAKPYHQAHARGVKLIGATALLVISTLDEGPIIEQNVERVNHSRSPSELVKIGAEIETKILARAVRWKAERRILENGNKTVVFT